MAVAHDYIEMVKYGEIRKGGGITPGVALPRNALPIFNVDSNQTVNGNHNRNV